MGRIRFMGTVASLLVAATAPASDEPRKSAETAPAVTADDREIDALILGYQTKRERLIKAYRGGKNEAGLLKIIEMSRFEEYGPKILAFAKAHPKQKAGLRALLWWAEHEAARRLPTEDTNWVFRQLARDHFDAPGLSAAFHHTNFPDPAWDELLRAAIARNPYRAVRGMACLSLGRYLGEISPWVEYREEMKGKTAQDRNKGMEILLERPSVREYVENLARRGHVAVAEESERLIERARDEFGSVEMEGGQTLADLAKSELYDRRALAIGTPAPEVSGEDVDGKPMKLSDYRGKVVVLSFWATWCGPCMELVPRERDLVKKYEGRPFVLLGINGDENRGAAKARVDKERITWRSWWNGGPEGAITRRWNIKKWPTLIVIDAKGVIREKGSLDEEELPELIDGLLKEAEPPGKPAPASR